MLNEEKKSADLRVRTKEFALHAIRLVQTIGDRGAGGVIGRQLIRSGTSVGAQYREACRARARAQFISKIESASQELDETTYWLELLLRSNLVEADLLTGLAKEADEIMRMLTASTLTAKRHR